MTDIFCPACGHHSQPVDRFCRACGDALNDEARASGPIGEAEALVARGMLEEAIATIQRAIGVGESADLHVALATLHLRRGGIAEAHAALERALVLEPGCAIAHAYIGGMLIHAGRVDEALEELDVARDLAPNDLVVLMKRAEFWLRLGIFANARDELRHGLQDGGGSPQTRAMAETMYASIEKRARNSFVRKTVTLPSARGLSKLFRRSGNAPATAIEVEA